MTTYTIEQKEEVMELNKPFLINGDIEILVFDDTIEFDAYIKEKYAEE